MNLRRALHDGCLVLCGALAAYLLSVVVAARAGLWLAATLRGSSSAAARLALGVVALDASKALGLLAVGSLLANMVSLRPLAVALGLVLTTYLFEVAVALLLQQADWLLLAPAVLVCRVVAAALLVAVVHLLVRRRRLHRARD
jgi:hypothetical protein